MSLNPIERVRAAIDEIRNGRMVILVDDEDRENEGDLVMAAEKVTVEALNFMETHARGWICVPLEGPRLDAPGKEMVRRDGVRVRRSGWLRDHVR